MILIDTNALIILLVGLIDTRIFKWHKRTSIYESQDFENLVDKVGDIKNLVVLPNVWTEADNLLNNFIKGYKPLYIETLTSTLKNTQEKFIETLNATASIGFYDLGITDSLLLEYARECQLLITADSKLSDYAKGYGIKVYDIVENRNNRF